MPIVGKMSLEKFARICKGQGAKKAAITAEADARYRAEKAARNARLTEAARLAGEYRPSSFGG
ncbi:MAG: hypothetical protein AAB731_01080 [Patescibacteria group bacterium]